VDESKSKIIKGSETGERIKLADQLAMSDSSALVAEVLDRSVLTAAEAGQIKKRDEIVKKALIEAKAIRDRAHQLHAKVEEVVRQSHKKGYEAGREEGLASVTETLVKLKAEHEKLLANLEKEAVALVYEIARKLLGDVLRTQDEALLGMVRQALSASMGQHITVFLHPEDFQRVRGHDAELMSATTGVQSLLIKPLESVRPSGCLIESDLGTIEADLEKQLAAIAKALGLARE
jgi:flagellar biosynthesis/type III secretory pathway protein FliH